jgi:regulatory protein
MPDSSKKYLSKGDALAQMQRYCAYQERCHKEVRSKLLDLGIYGDDLEEILADLVSENFLNEERFACTFARGKFRMKQWGRNRIARELKMRGISDYCIRKSLEEIGQEDYQETLLAILQKRAANLDEEDAFVRNYKLAQFAIQRGFEAEQVWQVLQTF